MDRVLPFDSTNEATAYIEKGRAKDKVVLKVRWREGPFRSHGISIARSSCRRHDGWGQGSRYAVALAAKEDSPSAAGGSRSSCAATLKSRLSMASLTSVIRALSSFAFRRGAITL